MDFSAILIIPLAAVLTTVWLTFDLARKRDMRLAPSFYVATIASILLMKPWGMIRSPADIPMAMLALVLIVLWVAAGCMAGAIPVAIARAICKRVGHP